jgi:hypothetical protein
VPLGALAHLLPAVDASSDALVLLQRTLQALAGNGTSPPPVLGIDDVHLLDPLSVTLLHQLAASGAVSLVLTVRTSNAAPDPSAPLWKDGLATRVELPPLDRAETEQLIGHALGGDVDTRTGERLWRSSRGSPLFLRELLDDGLAAGRLRNSAGLWRWEGPMLPSQRLAEIVLGHLGDVDAAERNALEVLAAAKPLSVRQVVSLSSPDAVAALERRGLIRVDGAGGAGQLRIAHPMYAEVVRCRASQAALRMFRQQLADGPADLGSPEHLVRRCAALLDSDAAGLDAGLLTDAARRALAMPDLRLAERLARAGIEAGGGVAAHLALVEAARWQGQPARAEELARAAGAVAATEDETAAVAASRAITLACAHA